ncbi:hypothetical protein TWF696_003672 [Orbilia brochopaga]|uniref:F-box domain-containing protein n=1 Tax=Orbilia brochopaga TaxID=3140254 RepID=A0AAV9V515_9PEZI
MVDRIPKEIWDRILKDFPFHELQTNIRPINKKLYALIGNIFHGLPPFLWDKVFEHLDHKDLCIAVRQTCKTFNLILQNTQSINIQEKLFTEPVRPDLLETYIAQRDSYNKTAIRIHPALTQTVLALPPLGARHGIVFTAEELEECFKMMPVPNENATSPAVPSLTLRLAGFRADVVLGETAVSASTPANQPVNGLPKDPQSRKRKCDRMDDYDCDFDGGGTESPKKKAITVRDVVAGIFSLLAQNPTAKRYFPDIKPKIKRAAEPLGYPVDDEMNTDLIGLRELSVRSDGPSLRLIGFKYNDARLDGEVLTSILRRRARSRGIEVPVQRY